MIKGRSLDHIGLASSCAEEDAKFYCDVLGFRVTGHFRNVWFVTNGSTVYEIYQDDNLPADARGKIDHISYTSRDIEADYKYAVEQGYKVVTDGIEYLDWFWDKGIRIFKIQTPGGQQIEFDQIL